MSRLALYTFGWPRIERDRVPFEIRRRRAMALLVYLAVTGRRQSRDALATLFYPEHDQRQARAGLRRTLSTLRTALGEGWLDVDLETVCLHPATEFWLDVSAFQGLIAECRAHGHSPDRVCPDCLPLLTEAAALYRDDFLAGFSLRDSAGFDDWQSFQTQGLRDQMASALERLACGHGEQGAFEPAIASARRWEALDPLNEAAQRCLMLAYARAGQRAAALQQYAACASLLAKELNVSPQPATLQLYREIQAGRVPAAPAVQLGAQPVAQPAAVQAPARKHNLPVPLTPFVGRHALLAEIAAHLEDPACRLLTLVGPGGCGKTRLAIEVASGLLDAYADGVFLVPLAALDAPQAVVPTIAATLGFRFYTEAALTGPAGSASDRREPSSPRQQLFDYVRDKRLLLILDNVEHLLEGGESAIVDLVSGMLQAAPGLQVLATSRARLGAKYEHLLPVPGMACAGGAPAGQYSAVRLFVQSARRVRSEFDLVPDNQADVVEICRRVQGLPLAILLAAAWVGMLSPAEIAHELEPAPGSALGDDGEGEPSRGLDLLGMELRDLPPRQRSIRAVFDRSWVLLSPHERTVMQALSVFRGGFTQEAAQQVAGASLHDLASLEQKSLLQRSSGDARSSESRYGVHELLRQYAAEKLGEDPRAARAALDRHCGYYAAALERWDAALKGPDQQAALAEMEREIENARAAWAWAVERRQVERLGQALDGLCRFYEWRVRFEDGAAACRAAAEKLEGTADPDGLRLLSRIRTWQSALNRGLGEMQLAGRLAWNSLALLARPELAGQDTRRERALALLQRGHLAHAADELRKAERVYASSGALFEAVEDRWSAAAVLHARGKVARAQGAYDRASTLYEQSLAIRRSLGDRMAIGDSLAALGRVHVYRGHLEQGAHLARASLAIRRELGDRAVLGYGLFGLGRILTGLGRYTEACELLEESYALARELGERARIIESRRALAFANLGLGRHEVARTLLQVNLDLARETHDLRGIADSLALLAPCALARQEYATALDMLQESIGWFRKSGQRDRLSWVLAGAAWAELLLGRRRQAQRHLSQALRIAAQLRAWVSLLYTLTVVALFLLEQGQVARALEIYEMLSRFAALARSDYIQDQFGRRIAAAAAELPADVAAAARARGQARDPALTVVELLIELNAARLLPGPLGRLGRPLARLLRTVLALILRRGS